MKHLASTPAHHATVLGAHGISNHTVRPHGVLPAHLAVCGLTLSRARSPVRQLLKQELSGTKCNTADRCPGARPEPKAPPARHCPLGPTWSEVPFRCFWREGKRAASLAKLCPFTQKGMRSPKFLSVLTDRNRGAWPMWPQRACEGEPSSGSMADPTSSGSLREQGGIVDMCWLTWRSPPSWDVITIFMI